MIDPVRSSFHAAIGAGIRVLHDRGMPSPKKPAVGTIAWRDLTVKDAEKVRDFYAQAVGWKVQGPGR